MEWGSKIMDNNKQVLAESKDLNSDNSLNSSIIAQYDVFNRDNMPAILTEIDGQFLEPLFPDTQLPCRLNILLANTISMLGFKQIKFKEFGNIKLVNHYAICFVESGGGKDEPLKKLSKHIFKYFNEYVKNKSIEYKNKKMADIEQEVNKLIADKKIKSSDKNTIINKKEAEIRDMVLEINLATPEGLFEDGVIISDAGYGSILVKISEFGLSLTLNDKTFIAFLICLFQGYDGIIDSKSIKYGKRGVALENIPINTLLFSDPSSVKETFNLLMETGLARRAFLIFQPETKKSIERDPVKAYTVEENAFNSASHISLKLFKIFQEIPQNAVYEMTKEAYLQVFYPYKIFLKETYNNIEDKALLKKEVASRELKVLKLACAFAALNHPTRLQIDNNDFLQAINVVNYLSKDFARFLKYKPVITEKYINLLEELIDNLGKKYTMTQFVMLACKHGFTKRYFRQYLNDEVNCLMEMAEAKGYILKPEKHNKNNATYFHFYKKCEKIEVSEL